MAHVRRKFEALAADDKNAARILKLIGTLYELEENLKHKNAPPDEIKKERKDKAYPIITFIEAFMKDIFKEYTPGEAMYKAIKYAFAVWVRIGRYTLDGHFLIDNNLMEQSVRPITLGRKNYLFCGNNQGAEDNAIFYTFMACCRDAGIEPYAWLTDVLSRPLPDTPEEELVKLLPANYKKQKQPLYANWHIGAII